MPQTIVLVATRKGLFVLESADRKDWSMRGPCCESWPLYHAILDKWGLEEGAITAPKVNGATS